MRKLLAIMIIILCVVGYYSYLNRDKFVKKEKLTGFDKIIELSSGGEDLDNPDDAIIRNNQIISYLYGGEIKPEEIETLINLQRDLFDPDLLEINPVELQIEKIKSKIQEYKEKGFKIITVKQKSATYEEKNKNVARIKVIQYTNGESDNYLEYYLRKQVDGTWRILGWKVVDQFEISEES